MIRINRIGFKQLLEYKASNGDILLKSYEIFVAARIGDKFYRVGGWYSMTTTNHINLWLTSRKVVKESVEKKPPEFFTQALEDMRRREAEYEANLNRAT